MSLRKNENIFVCLFGCHALSDNFLDKGKTATLYGAKAGCKCNTVLTSPSAISCSSYALHKNASVTLSAPSDGSITYGTYFSFVSGSKYVKSSFEASICLDRS